MMCLRHLVEKIANLFDFRVHCHLLISERQLILPVGPTTNRMPPSAGSAIGTGVGPCDGCPHAPATAPLASSLSQAAVGRLSTTTTSKAPTAREEPTFTGRWLSPRRNGQFGAAPATWRG